MVQFWSYHVPTFPFLLLRFLLCLMTPDSFLLFLGWRELWPKVPQSKRSRRTTCNHGGRFASPSVGKSEGEKRGKRLTENFGHFNYLVALPSRRWTPRMLQCWGKLCKPRFWPENDRNVMNHSELLAHCKNSPFPPLPLPFSTSNQFSYFVRHQLGDH